MPLLKYILPLLLFCSSFPVARAQTFLSLDSCRALAITHNNRAKTAQIQVEKMRYEVNAYRANFFPRISLQGMYLLSSGEFGYRNRFDLYNTPIPELIGTLPIFAGWDSEFLDRLYRSLALDLDLTVKPHNTYMAGIRFEQPIFMGGKITTAHKMAQIGRQMAQLDVVHSQEEIILQTDKAYWEYVKVQELYRAALAYRDAVGQVCDDARNGVETGLLPENDRLKAQVQFGEANLLVRQAENGRRLAQMNLCMTLGLPLWTLVVPLDSLPDTAATVWPESTPDVTVRTEYALLHKQMELQRQQVNLARSEFLPQAGITGGYMYFNGMKLNDGAKLLDNASFSALVSLTIPITQWGEGINRIRSARADLRMAEYRMQESLDKLCLEIVKTGNTLDEAALQTAIARDEYAQATENLRIRRDRYEVGLENLSSLLEAQALHQQAGSKYIEAKAALRIAETDYLRVTGRLKETKRTP
ncbi:MAG: TolC family protein [Prevotellaceae bacterium]|jgi:outer membrane protein TolC|nr:TolC family protein [Prevotellaceae bacterium]